MLRNESDLLRSLAEGTYTVTDLYALAEAHGLDGRPGGRDIIQDGHPQYRRRVRTALQHLKRKGCARRVGAGMWAIHGTVRRPLRCLLVFLPDEPGHVELVLGEVTEVLAAADEPIDLIVADPPWGLGRHLRADRIERAYRGDRSKVVAGYLDVDPSEYAEFTERWMLAATAALRPGGHLAVVTGAQQAARVQIAGEDHCGLTYVNSLAVKRTFGMYATRRFVHQHNTVTLLTKGPLHSARRFFERPNDLPRGRNGNIYAVDVWLDIPDERRPGRLRYDNALSPALVSRLVRSCTRERDLVADPFLGSGTTAVVCHRHNRRFYGGDANPESLRFTMARFLDEELPAARLV